MGQTLDSDDMISHTLVVGGTRTGKTNAILHMIDLLFGKKYDDGIPRPAIFLFDPAGDASIDILRAIPKSEWHRVTILDPEYVTFGFSLLSLPEGLDDSEKPEATHALANEFSLLLSDAFNTEPANTPRLLWIFKGALYCDFKITPHPTLWEIYNITLDFTKRDRREIEELLNREEVQKDIIQGTMEAISKLPQEAYMSVLNRISNFVLPQSSTSFRVFCCRESTFDLEKLMEPGNLTIFRIPPDLSDEFRRIFATAVVMKLYFASVKRAKRLERSGQPPVARTPVIFAADEFRDIAQLRILRTILSQARKYGLYLWMVAQTLSDIPDDLVGSIEANVGPILAFRTNSEDARRLAKVLYPEEADEVAKLISGLEDYAAIVRKRPVGGKPLEPPFRVTFPKLRDPLCGYAEALDYMKVDMERKYGGAKGDTELLYKKELEKIKKDSNECWLGEPQLWVPLAYLHCHGETGFKPLSKIFESSYGWSPNTLQVGLSRLTDSGRVEESAGTEPTLKGTDPQTGQAVSKEAETHDEQMGTRGVFYKITDAAEKQFFEFKLVSPERAGGPLHVKVMRALLENYWSEGFWCVWDRGDTSEQFPDLLVTPPLMVQVKGKEGKQLTILNPKEWDVENRIPVEVETNPSKHLKQLRTNYEKNVAKHGRVRFVVPSRSQEEEVRRLLEDKDPSTFEVVVEGAGLPMGELERLMAEEERNNVTSQPAHPTEAESEDNQPEKENNEGHATPQKNELWILAKICISGYTGRSALASGIGTAERQVSRYLETLEARGLLERQGNGYRTTAKGVNLVERTGLTSASLPAESARLDLEMSSFDTPQA